MPNVLPYHLFLPLMVHFIRLQIKKATYLFKTYRHNAKIYIQTTNLLQQKRCTLNFIAEICILVFVVQGESKGASPHNIRVRVFF